MSIEPTLEEQKLLADTLRRRHSGMTARERVATTITATGFAIAVAAIWLIHPPHGLAIVPAVLCVLVLALATQIEFDTPFGFTVPTQLAFVPLVFVVPLALVPIAAAVAMVIPRLGKALKGEIPPSRLVAAIPNAWFAIGPVAVFAIADVEPRNAGAVLLLAALVAQCSVDFVVAKMYDGITYNASIGAQLRETWVFAVDAALSGIGLVVAQDLHHAPSEVLFLVPLLALFAVFARERNSRLRGLLELSSAYRGTALVLSDVVESDDHYTGQHSRSVVALALELAQDLEPSEERLRNLEFAALLHDVGKIAIPKEIVNKPGKLSPEEWTIIQTHTLEGERLLAQVGGFMREVGLLVRSHHERWDGRGYPDGLAGEEIPLEAGIIACCDSWNAMRTDRVYRKALPLETALEELTGNAGSQFDPHLVEALLPIIERTEGAPAPALAESPIPDAPEFSPDKIALDEVFQPNAPKRGHSTDYGSVEVSAPASAPLSALGTRSAGLRSG
jgi:HD-GYP domain-containing protein (c-di-GMP phosphodiesterase class II)